MSENYDKILRDIVFAIRVKDEEKLKKYEEYLKENNLKGILLGMSPKDYEAYHVILENQNIQDEVKERYEDYEQDKDGDER